LSSDLSKPLAFFCFPQNKSDKILFNSFIVPQNSKKIHIELGAKERSTHYTIVKVQTCVFKISRGYKGGKALAFYQNSEVVDQKIASWPVSVFLDYCTLNKKMKLSKGQRFLISVVEMGLFYHGLTQHDFLMCRSEPSRDKTPYGSLKGKISYDYF